MLKKGSTATSPSDIAVDVRSVVKVFTQSQRENAGNGVLKRLARPEKKRVYALDNVTFQIRRGEFVAYAGPNGGGQEHNDEVTLWHAFANGWESLRARPVA